MSRLRPRPDDGEGADEAEPAARSVPLSDAGSEVDSRAETTRGRSESVESSATSRRGKAAQDRDAARRVAIGRIEADDLDNAELGIRDVQKFLSLPLMDWTDRSRSLKLKGLIPETTPSGQRAVTSLRTYRFNIDFPVE